MDNTAELLIKGDRARLEGNWTEARALYQQAMPDPQAARGLSKLDKIEAQDKEIQELIQTGCEQFQARQYETAYETFRQALNRAAFAGILTYHADLEKRIREAHELWLWQQRCQQVQADAAQAGCSGQWETVCSRLNELLANQPAGDLYQAVAEAARAQLEQAEQQVGADTLYHRGVLAFEAQNHREAIRLFEKVPPDSTRYRRAQEYLQQAGNILYNLIEPKLKSVRQDIEAEQWGHAQARLAKLREQFKENPDWQELWIQVGQAHGQQALDQGRQANARRDFAAAQRHFEQAKAAFSLVLEEYPAHLKIQAYRDEADDLARISIYEAQAQSDWGQGQREQAQHGLAEAARLIEQAAISGRDYSTVAAVVKAMQQGLQTELERIKADEARLQDGQRRLERRPPDLAGAETHFKDSLAALLPEHQRWAREGLNRVEVEIKKFESYMEGGKAGEPARRVEALRAAHQHWPDGPGAAQALEEALTAAGEAALAAGQLNSAAAYFEEALHLNPDSSRARRGQIQVGLGPRVQEVLEEVERELPLLSRADEEAGDKKLQALANRLDELALETKDFEDLAGPVKARQQQVQQQQQQWQVYRGRLKGADDARQAGEWAAAAATLEQALGEAGGAAPTARREQLARWQEAARRIKTDGPAITAALTAAQTAYKQAAETTDLADCLAELAHLEKSLRPVEQAVEAAGGGLPTELQSMQEQATDLRDRVESARKALAGDTASKGIASLRPALQKWPDDPTLRAIEQQLVNRLKQEREHLLQQADGLVERGELAQVVELLREAQEILPGDSEIAARYNKVTHRRKLEEAVRQAEQDYQTKLGTRSLPDALKALERGLELFLGPDSDLSNQERELLVELINLSRQHDGLAYGIDAYWDIAQVKLGELNRLGAQEGSDLRAASLAGQWVDLARNIALRGVIASYAALNDLRGSYQAAVAYMRRNPMDEAAINEMATRQERLLEYLNESVKRRLSRARETLERGEFELALENLASIEAKDGALYGGIEQEFPGLLAGYDEVARLRAEAEELTETARRQQELSTKARPLLEEAEKLFLADEFDQAEAKLRALPADLRLLPRLAEWARSLGDQIRLARSKRANETLAVHVRAAETRLRLARTQAEIEAILTDLETLPHNPTIEWAALATEERQPYFNLLDQVKNRREEFVAGTTWEASATAALKETPPNYLRAMKALEKALLATRDGREKVRIETWLEEIQARAEQQQAFEEAYKKGRDLFHEKAYILARQNLSKAAELAGMEAAEVNEWLRAARAGAVLEEARQTLADQTVLPENIQADLERAVSLAQGNKHSEEILLEAERLQTRLTRQQAAKIKQEAAAAEAEAEKRRQQQEGEERRQRLTAELLSLMMEAENAYARNDLKAAEEGIKAALLRDSGYEAALALQQKVQKAYRLETLLQEAEKSLRDGNIEKARSLVATILAESPEHIQATTLAKQVDRYAEVYTLLRSASAEADQGEFEKARQKLQQAVTLDIAHERVKETQVKIDGRERDWQKEKIEPIRRLFRDGQYKTAYQDGWEVLGKTRSTRYTDDLKRLLNQITGDWLSNLRQQVTQTASENILAEMVVQLKPLVTSQLPPDEDLQEQCQQLYTQAKERLLRLKMERARRITEQKEPDWIKAINLLEEVGQEAESPNVATESSLTLRKYKDAYYSQLISQARAAYEQAKTRLDLETARKQVQEICQNPDFEDERETIELNEQITTALQLYETSERTLAEVERLIRARSLSDAEDQLLQLTPVSPLFHDRYKNRRDLLKLLRQAGADHDSKQWAAALEGYRQVIAHSPDLELDLSLRDEMEHCRNKLMDEALRQIRQYLEAVPPHIEQAEQILTEIETRDWFIPAFRNRLADLRQTIAQKKLETQATLESQRWETQAVALLEGEDGDVTEALTMLEKARSLRPSTHPGDALNRWIALAHALQAWQANDPVKAEKLLAEGPPESTRARRLQEEIAQAHKLAGQLAELEQQLKRHLQAVPPQHAAAVQAIQEALTMAGPHNRRLQELRQQVINRLRTSWETYSRAEEYDLAIALGASLLRLTDEATLRDQVEALPRRRRARLDDILAQAANDLSSYHLEQARAALQQANNLAGTEGDPRLPELQNQLHQREQDKKQLDDRLNEIKQLIALQKWPEAVDQLLPVRQAAADYPPVITFITELQNWLAKLARNHLNVNEFTPALEKCDLVLRLGELSEIGDLRRQIEEAREAYLGRFRRQIEEALSLWDAKKAQQAWAAAPADVQAELSNLQQQLERMPSVEPEIRREMEASWVALGKRDYPAARKSFNHILHADLAPHFNEARCWLNYTEAMDQASQDIENGLKPGRAFETALSKLQWAMACLQSADNQFTPILNNPKERRERAIAEVSQLHRVAGLLVNLQTQYQKYASTTDKREMEQARQLYKQMIEQQQEFNRLHQNPGELSIPSSGTKSAGAWGATGAENLSVPTPPAPSPEQSLEEAGKLPPVSLPSEPPPDTPVSVQSASTAPAQTQKTPADMPAQTQTPSVSTGQAGQRSSQSPPAAAQLPTNPIAQSTPLRQAEQAKPSSPSSQIAEEVTEAVEEEDIPDINEDEYELREYED